MTTFSPLTSNTSAPATAADCGSITLTLRLPAEPAAAENEPKNKHTSRIEEEPATTRIPFLLFTRKRLKVTERDGLLASRVRMQKNASQPACRPSRDSFPVTGGNVLAYSCAAARDSHPLPCLRRAAKTRVPDEMPKSRKTVPRI